MRLARDQWEGREWGWGVHVPDFLPAGSPWVCHLQQTSLLLSLPSRIDKPPPTYRSFFGFLDPRLFLWKQAQFLSITSLECAICFLLESWLIPQLPQTLKKKKVWGKILSMFIKSQCSSDSHLTKDQGWPCYSDLGIGDQGLRLT